jgi:hypothetical protein
MFAGRYEELKKLDRVLYQTKNGNPHHFIIEGERGIGKSSLLLYLDTVASGAITGLSGSVFNFLTVNIELEPDTTYSGIISNIGRKLRRELANHDRTRELIKTGWDFLKKWEAFGVKYNPEENTVPPQQLMDDLTLTFEEAMKRVSTNFDGILITIDEADKPNAGANLGEFSKLFTERMMKSGCDHVALGLSGLPQLTRKLRESHESSPRIFENMPLPPLSSEDRYTAIDLGLAAAKEKNGVETTIATDAKNLVATMSEGYPSFIQQFAYNAFEEDSDNEIQLLDVMNGAYKPNGGLHQLGVAYFHDLYFEKISSNEYRQVLRAMAEHRDQWVTKAQIRKKLNLKEYTLANAIAALITRNIIIPQVGKKGVYRLPTRSFAAWITAFTNSDTPDSVSPTPAEIKTDNARTE